MERIPRPPLILLILWLSYNKMRRLLSLEAFLVDERQDRAPNRRRQRGATYQIPVTATKHKLPVTHRPDIRVGSAEPVVHALLDVRKVAVERELAVAIERQRLAHRVHVPVHLRRLVRRLREDVAKASTAGEPRRRHLVQLLIRRLGCAVREPIPLGAADR
ncbi:hypothetical protein RRF57_009586 [Xylaria bambusicola]|uniref:Uncharacterized protein n=1 Tax=Xylaria bambusicola TaxID=326684 RepID=A0AAN7Z7Y6_9PEZI